MLELGTSMGSLSRILQVTSSVWVLEIETRNPGGP